MTKQEFLGQLRRSLTGNTEYHNVESHMRYYTEYIEIEMRKGRSEEDVMAELGDPRLISKTLLEAEEAVSEATSGEYREFVDEEEPVRKRTGNIFVNGKAFRLPGWALALILCVVLMSVFSLIFTVLSLVLPYLLLVLAAVFLYRWIRRLL